MADRSWYTIDVSGVVDLVYDILSKEETQYKEKIKELEEHIEELENEVYDLKEELNG